MDEEVKKWLGENNTLGYDIWNKKYRHNGETFEQWLNRVSNGNDEIKDLILNKRFLFGGRILANRGLHNSSLANCATLGRVPDSIKGVMDIATKLAITFKAEQGQGLSLSDIRPKGSMIQGLYESDGIIPFMKLFDTTTSTIMQGGHRRGALLMALDIWHKETKNFITVKSDLNCINNANLSLEIDDKFMNIVKKDYTYGTKTNVKVTKTYNGNDITYNVCPIELFKFLCKYAWQVAEPGILYTDKLFNYNLMQHIEEYNILSTNACSEQPLPPNGMCMLSSFNLGAYVNNPYTSNCNFDFDKLNKDIRVVIKAMDDIVDENIELCPLQEQKDVAKKYRNIGVGYFGMADMLVKMGLTYGHTDAEDFIKKICKNFFREMIFADVQLAEERGSFPGYSNKIWDSDIIKNNDAFTPYEIDKLKSIDKLRNCSLISIAPNGSIGTMLNCSTGCEPYFALSYNRRTVSMGDNTYKVYVPTIEEYMAVNNTEEIPDYFVTAHNIHWTDRVDMQSIMQKYCDTAISSTCNIPKDITVSEVEQMYLYAWEKGCKGFTCYRDGCREGVLTTSDSNPNVNSVFNTTVAPKRPKTLDADFYQVKANGENFRIFIGLLDGKPYELFAMPCQDCEKVPNHKGKITKLKKKVYKFESEVITIDNIAIVEIEEHDIPGEIANIENIIKGDNKLNNDEIDRITKSVINVKNWGKNNDREYRNVSLHISGALRHGMPLKSILSLEDKCNDNIVSFNKAVSRVLSKYLPNEESGDKCPECGSDLRRESGCILCPNCGWSKCN